jgi:hypothetical protein
MSIKSRGVIVPFTCTLALLFFTAPPAFSRIGDQRGDTITITSDIRAGNNAQQIGTAVVTREDGADRRKIDEVLTVHLDVSETIDESHVCLSSSPFTARVAPGSCPFRHGSSGTNDRYEIDLGDTYAGETLFAQVHVASAGETAYVAWHAGTPFYGNLEVPDPAAETSVPTGAFGGLGLAALLGGGLVLLNRRRAVPTAP